MSAIIWPMISQFCRWTATTNRTWFGTHCHSRRHACRYAEGEFGRKKIIREALWPGRCSKHTGKIHQKNLVPKIGVLYCTVPWILGCCGWGSGDTFFPCFEYLSFFGDRNFFERDDFTKSGTFFFSSSNQISTLFWWDLGRITHLEMYSELQTFIIKAYSIHYNYTV